MSLRELYRAVTRSVTNRARGILARVSPALTTAVFPPIRIETEEEYSDALNRYAIMTLSLYKSGIPVHNSEADALYEAMGRFERSSFKYRIICCKEHYAGLGVTWVVGQQYDVFHVREHAEGYLRVLNRQGVCWKLVVDPPPSND